MIQKSSYVAPAMEQLEVRYAVNIMSNITTTVPVAMSVWDEQEI